ncbi:DUF927 domain-containing protein [Lamprobacter modestohalophilus]|uniref:DUF927 domain-containing protein n=1 Tax=Lamprobacter modestohalophilus TaxID=1064514 RepID=UPI002ADEB472|nr:DUF927 domain-containing protein [Lamprobacter modestohalophilus]MEA1048386.1 DUF927 domain-containing protein [Lamprobacter modestohalophilus]
MAFPMSPFDYLSRSDYSEYSYDHQFNSYRLGDYLINETGVYLLVNGQPTYLCAPLMRQYSLYTDSGQWLDGIVFVDFNGHSCWHMPPRSQLHQGPKQVLSHLLNHGLDVAAGMETEVLEFLRACMPLAKARLAQHLGWQRNLGEALVFAKADSRHIASRGAPLVLVDPQHTTGASVLSASGTLSDWQQAVAMPVCRRHTLPLFALAASFAVALLRFAQASDSFVLHFWGLTTTGKTTQLQLSASGWGCASDPKDSTQGNLRRWSTTANAVEALAAEHMDLPLVLDEFGASAVDDPQSLIYLLAGGEGKARMKANGQRDPSKTWCTIVMSSGEASIIASMGKRPPDGVFHRLLEIEIDPDGIAPGESDPERFVRTLKTACSTYYGTAGPAFVQAIVERFSTRSEVERFVRECVEEVLTELLPQGHVKPMVERALRRFGLISVAGEFAADVGILPISPTEVRAAVKHVAARWLDGLAKTDPSRLVVNQVREFLMLHAARFQDINTAKAPPIANRFGWVDHGNQLWYFTDDALAKAVPGMTADQIAQELKRNKLLNSDKDGRMKKKVTISKGERPRLYAVLGSIFDHGDGEAEAEAEAQGSTQTANVSWLRDAA